MAEASAAAKKNKRTKNETLSEAEDREEPT